MLHFLFTSSAISRGQVFWECLLTDKQSCHYFSRVTVYPARAENNKMSKVRPERLKDSVKVTELGFQLSSDPPEPTFITTRHQAQPVIWRWGKPRWWISGPFPSSNTDIEKELEECNDVNGPNVTELYTYMISFMLCIFYYNKFLKGMMEGEMPKPPKGLGTFGKWPVWKLCISR